MSLCVYLCLTEGSVQALACYIWTSGNGGKQLVPAAPWCCPCVPHLRSGSPDHRAPSLACREREGEGGRGRGREREGERGLRRKVKSKKKKQWRQIRNMWEKKKNKKREVAAIFSSDIGRDGQRTKAVINQYSLISDCFVVFCCSMRAGLMTLLWQTHLHMSGLVCYHKGRGETILMVQSAAPHRMAHACDRGVT